MVRRHRLFWLPLLFCSFAFGPSARADESLAQTIATLQNTADSPWLSPNHRFELYTRTVIFDAENDVMEQALFIRRAGDDEPGIGLQQFKYFDVHWSPDSKYVAISGHFLDHNADFFLYRVTAPTRSNAIKLELLQEFHAKDNPVEWTFQDWLARDGKVRVKRTEAIASGADKPVDTPESADAAKSADSVQSVESSSILDVSLSGKPLKTIRYSVDEPAPAKAKPTPPAKQSAAPNKEQMAERTAATEK